ncbi:MAG: ADP-ribosylation factor-like protein [Promethearchaeota archaeon]
MEYLREEKPETSKILFSGLDDAGKTSIILALQREFSKIANIEPTKGAQRRMFEFLGKNISEWDLGGQQTYRIAYLKNPTKYFTETEVLIYVIDIRNKQRIQESLSYLKDVINEFRNLEIEPPIFIFFHKYDPALTRNSYEEIDKLILYLRDKILSIPNYKKFYFRNTTIYDLSTLISAMSEALLSIYPKTDLIQQTIYEFGIKSKADGIAVIDSNSLIIGWFYRYESMKDILLASTPYFLSLNTSFDFTEGMEDNDENKMIIQRHGKYFLFRKFSLNEEVEPFYLLISKDDPEINKEGFNALINILTEILYQ